MFPAQGPARFQHRAAPLPPLVRHACCGAAQPCAQAPPPPALAPQECTTFHFDVKPDALRPALDRFSQFFLAPLVKADALGREVQAVDNEFAGVLQVGGGRPPAAGCYAACALQTSSRTWHACEAGLEERAPRAVRTPPGIAAVRPVQGAHGVQRAQRAVCWPSRL